MYVLEVRTIYFIQVDASNIVQETSCRKANANPIYQTLQAATKIEHRSEIWVRESFMNYTTREITKT